MAAQSATRFYGWRPDKPDHRDRLFLAHNEVTLDVPAEIDLRQWCPPVMNQGNLGACTAHGITGIIRFDRIKAGLPDFPLSRLQLYYDERFLENTTESDSGAEIRDGIKVAAKNGVAPEELWVYNTQNFTTPPPQNVYEAALKDRALTYESVAVNVSAVKTALASGFPVVVGISIYQSFESDEVAKTGIVPMPGNEPMLGGHCIYVVGYGQKPGYFTLRNSWGVNWGDKGDFYLPEAYLGNPKLASDFWIIKSVSALGPVIS